MYPVGNVPLEWMSELGTVVELQSVIILCWCLQDVHWDSHCNDAATSEHNRNFQTEGRGTTKHSHGGQQENETSKHHLSLSLEWEPEVEGNSLECPVAQFGAKPVKYVKNIKLIGISEFILWAET